MLAICLRQYSPWWRFFATSGTITGVLWRGSSHHSCTSFSPSGIAFVVRWPNGCMGLYSTAPLVPLVSLRHSIPLLQSSCSQSVVGPRCTPCTVLRDLRCLALCYSSLSLHETSFTLHPLGNCFPVGTLRGSWSWRDLFTGNPQLVSVHLRVQCLRRIQAQRTSDLDRDACWTLPYGKASQWALRARSYTCPVSPKALGATVRNSFMSGTRPLVTTTAKKPPRLPSGGPY